MKPESPDPTDKLLDDIHDIHTSAWAKATPPASREEAYERAMSNAMRSLSVELLKRGVTTAIMEGAYLIWWLRVACMNHRFADGGFERSLSRIGPLIGPVSDIMIRLGEEIEDDGPVPELKLLGEKLEEVRGLFGGSVATWPKSREAEDAQTQTAHALIQQTLLVSTDVGIPPGVIEGMPLYFWFRCTANRHGLKEAFFQKLERHWDLVMEHVNRYRDEQSAADRRRG
jgi:hypothetical protein